MFATEIEVDTTTEEIWAKLKKKGLPKTTEDGDVKLGDGIRM